MRFFKMEKCNFLKILQCPDFENLWGDFWHLSQPKNLDESDGGFFLRIIFSSHVHSFESSINLSSYLQALGIGFFVRQLALAARPTVVLTRFAKIVWLLEI